MLLGFARRYEPDLQFGTVIARMAVVVPAFWVAWVAVLAAFSVPADMATATDPAKAGATSLRTPFQLLGGTLDELVAAGAMPVARRPGAEFLAWSAVHGLAVLLIDGPLRAVDETAAAAAADRLVGMVERGLQARARRNTAGRQVLTCWEAQAPRIVRLARAHSVRVQADESGSGAQRLRHAVRRIGVIALTCANAKSRERSRRPLRSVGA